MTSTPDDAELRFDAILLRHVDDVVDTRETSILESSGQKYRKEILPLGDHILARRPGTRVNEHQSHQRNGQSGEPAHRNAEDSGH